MFSIGTAAFGVFALLLAPVQDAVLAGVILFAIGISFTLFTANGNALVQLAAPDHLRGRLISLYLFAFLGLAPVGGLFAGWLAEVGGTTLAFAVAGTVSTRLDRSREPLPDATARGRWWRAPGSPPGLSRRDPRAS